MRTIKFKLLVHFFIYNVLIFSFLCCKNTSKEKTKNSENYEVYCGSCHLTPDPKNIPKSFWKNNVLPEMAAKMGYDFDGYKPPHRSMEEKFYVNRSNAYPKTPMLDSVKWNQIQKYVLGLAPDTVFNVPTRKGRNASIAQFKPFFDSVNTFGLQRNIVHLNYINSTNEFFVGDIQGNVYDVANKNQLYKKFNSPVVSTFKKDSTYYVTEVGILNPSEIPKGAIYKGSKEVLKLIQKDLHRPVFTEVVDINKDGIEEIIICEFGYHTGALSMLVENNGTFVKKTISALPGSIKLEVRDMNQDGQKDIVVLFSQAREGIYVFYQKENLEFEMEQLIAMGPEYGISFFEMVDYNKDGFLDIVLVNGDNADYSNFLKPYHGVRIYINDGTNKFKQEWFYPINGATRVLVEDFDQDGDVDFAISSFFPDVDNAPEEGFVYLENVDSGAYLFKSYVTSKAEEGNWLVMEKGDFDQDGDVDIMLGGFSLLHQKKVNSKKSYSHLILSNELK